MRDTDERATIDWLLAGDAAIRWQALRDLADAPEEVWQAERRKVEIEGWGARLLSFEDADGQWAGGAFFPADFTKTQWHDHGQPWTATAWALTQLREFGLDPGSTSARRAVERVGLHCRWEEGGQPFWQGEVEECINGRTVAAGAYFGVDVSAIVDRLLGERLSDGGWNCERVNGSIHSSFASTINVLEGLLEFECATGGTPASRKARNAGEEYLLSRRLFRRLSTGEAADDKFLRFVHPERWRYDLLRALDYFRAAALLADADPDSRLQEAITHVRSRRRDDGRWALDWKQRGREWFAIDDGVGEPSRWITLRASRVLRWWRGDQRQRPERRSEIVVRRADLVDAAVITSTLRDSITELCGADHGQRQEVLDVWLDNKTVANVDAWIRSPANVVLVATAGSMIAGVGCLRDDGEVLLNYVAPRHRFRGVSKAIIADIEKRARQRGSARLNLESTGTALSFYRAAGFAEVGPATIKHGVEAYPMTKVLT